MARPGSNTRSRLQKDPTPTPVLHAGQFDMLAGSERVHPMVDAVAGIGERTEASDLHLVAAAAGRADAEVTKKSAVRLERDDDRSLGTPAPAAQADSSSSLVRQPETGAPSSTAAAAFPLPARRLRLVAGCLALGDRLFQHLSPYVLQPLNTAVTVRVRHNSGPAESASARRRLWCRSGSIRNMPRRQHTGFVTRQGSDGARPHAHST